MAQLTDIDEIIRQGIGLQQLRNRTAQVGINRQNANTNNLNALTSRVDTLMKGNDFETAEKLLNQVNNPRGFQVKLRSDNKSLQVKGPNGAVKIYGYDKGNFSRTVKEIEGAGFGSQQFAKPEKDEFGNIVQTEQGTGKVRVLDRGSAIFSEPFTDRQGNRVQRNTQTGEIKVLSRKGQGGGSLEEARQAFLSGNASKEQLALIRQDETEFVKDYVESFGALVGPRQSQELRKQGSLLFEVERLGSNPLPENITSTSAAVEYLVENLKFDEDQAKEIVRQIMRAERAVTE